jgi:hypothetical protein
VRLRSEIAPFGRAAAATGAALLLAASAGATPISFSSSGFLAYLERSAGLEDDDADGARTRPASVPASVVLPHWRGEPCIPPCRLDDPGKGSSEGSHGRVSEWESSIPRGRQWEWRSRGEWGDDEKDDHDRDGHDSHEREEYRDDRRRHDDDHHGDGHHDDDRCDDDGGGGGHPVPEPGTVLLFGAGILGLGRRISRR